MSRAKRADGTGSSGIVPHHCSPFSLVSSFHKIVILLVESALFASHASCVSVTADLDDLWVEVSDRGSGLEKCDFELITTLNRFGDISIKRDEERSRNITRVDNIFKYFPLRRRTMRPRVESAIIKEYILKTSLLHFHVEWGLAIICDAQEVVLSIPKSGSLVSSLASKFSDVAALISRTEVINSCFGDYTIRGVISPPLIACCLPSMAHQYLFINHKWHSPHPSTSTNTCLVQSTVNEMYETALQATTSFPLKTLASNAGPLPRHYQPDNQSILHPIYVLDVECRAESYSILNKSGVRDGDIIFHNGIDLIECMHACLAPIFIKYIPQYLRQCHEGNTSSGDSTFNQRSSNRMITSTATKRKITPPQQFEKRCFVSNFTHEEDRSADVKPSSKRQIDLLFQYGFLDKKSAFPGHGQSNPPRDGRDEGASAGLSNMDSLLKRRRVSASRETSGDIDFDMLMLWERGYCDRDDEYKDDEYKDDEYTNDEYRDDVYRGDECKDDQYREVDNINDEYRDDKCRINDCSYRDDEYRYDEYRDGEYRKHGEVEEWMGSEKLYPTGYFLVADEGYSSEVLPVSEAVVGDSPLIPSQRGLELESYGNEHKHDLEQHSDIAPSVSSIGKYASQSSNPNYKYREYDSQHYFSPDVSVERREDVNLNNDFYTAPAKHHFPTLSSFTRHLEPTSLSKDKIADSIVVLDQVENKFIIAMGDDQVLALDQHAIHERILLEQLQDKLKKELPLQQYVRAGAHKECFIDNRLLDCVTHSSELLRTWGFQHYTLQKKDDVEKSLLKFHKLPLIENEPLTANDFLEFMIYAQEHMCLPDHLKSPPAVQRILASKACRTAVKFGEPLSGKECTSLLKSVVRCANPFQCAHGRPSIVPLLHMWPKKVTARKRILMSSGKQG